MRAIASNPGNDKGVYPLAERVLTSPTSRCFGHRLGAREGVTMEGAFDRTREADLTIHALSAREWRVSDAALPARNSLSVLGFIELKGHVYEAMQIGHGFEWFAFDTFDAAIEHFVGMPRASASTHALASLRPGWDAREERPPLLA
jgi:hypothetical protein